MLVLLTVSTGPVPQGMIEIPACRLEVCRSIQLSYWGMCSPFLLSRENR